jgi:hypothetical protein
MNIGNVLILLLHPPLLMLKVLEAKDIVSVLFIIRTSTRENFHLIVKNMIVKSNKNKIPNI